MEFWIEYQRYIVVAILTLAISGAITFLYKKGKTIVVFLKKKTKEATRRKEYEKQIEEDKNRRWVEINNRIDTVINDLNNFKKHYNYKIPNSKKRIKYFTEYLNLLDEGLTPEQENKLLDIKEMVFQLYKELLVSNNVSKKEKKIYSEYLERENNYENNTNSGHNS